MNCIQYSNKAVAILITCNFDLSSSSGKLLSCSFFKNTLVLLCCSSEFCKKTHQLVKLQLLLVRIFSKHHTTEQRNSDTEQPFTHKALFSVLIQVQRDSCTLRKMLLRPQQQQGEQQSDLVLKKPHLIQYNKPNIHTDLGYFYYTLNYILFLACI